MAISYHHIKEDGVIVYTTVAVAVRLFNETNGKRFGINVLTGDKFFHINHANGNDELTARFLFKRFILGMVRCRRHGYLEYDDEPERLLDTVRAGITECVTRFAENDKKPYVIHYKGGLNNETNLHD